MKLVTLIKQQLLIKLTPYLFLFPALLLLGITILFPTFQAFYLSFTQYNYDLTQPSSWIGLENFYRLSHDSVFWRTLINTVLYLFGVVPFLVSLPLLLAILVNNNLRGIHLFRLAFYIPVIISTVVVGITWKTLYGSNGLFNQLLSYVGLLNGVPWLTSTEMAIWSVMLVTIWKGLGYYMMIYLAGLQGIPKELYEAAAIDGSDGWQKHLDITIPLMRSYILLVTVISSISAIKTFEEVYIMTQGGPLNSSKTIVYYLYEKAFHDLDINYACTIGLVLFLIILAFSIINLKISVYYEK
ncbi:MAG: carbohydrate ABC transporter membrane protein 1, CUT1 family [Candidatus Atelocyanobacterium thalassa isolate SIO64986]|uniref:Carbohydrate ABC transporter membrane protein 1, CUT1 family n=1 Tax=Candidatus Atelocyanobacterium thalassa isolate SIO64986 TaxID=1527444 RepID=A0A086CGZ0_9CHRO|nr:MAG: carbohydrate ABC transporter membrane protein 1, CUT1 family [Candidatus Atelocyanobacterium thalassa isolate SIO64986]